MGKVMPMLGGGGADLDMITASQSDVLAGKVIVDRNGDPLTGTMPERGNWTGSVPMNGSVTIPDGHHSGSGKVNGPAVTNRGAWAGSVGMNTQITIPEGYHNGAGKVSGPSVPVRGAGTKAVSGGFNNEGLFYYIPKGYWNPDNSGNSWTYLTRQEVANIIGLNGGNIRSGVNYCGVQGSMVDYSYLAVNQVPFDGASFSGVMAEGAEVCYADPSNYLRRDAPEITSNGLRMYTSTATNAYPHLCPKKSIDFSPFREVRITGKFTGTARGAGSFKAELWNINVDKVRMLSNRATGALAYNSVSLDYANAEYTCAVDVSGVSGQAYLTVMFSNDQYLAWPNYFIKRIEFIA